MISAGLLATALENSKLKGLATNGLLSKLKPGMSPEEMAAVVTQVLSDINVSVEGAGRAALIQSVILSSGLSPTDLAKIVRVQKTIADGAGGGGGDGSVDLGSVINTVNDILEPRSKDLIQALKSSVEQQQPLQG